LTGVKALCCGGRRRGAEFLENTENRENTLLVPRTGIEPVLLADADFKSATSTNFVTRALQRRNIIADFQGELFAE